MLNESLQADAAMVASVGGRRMVVPWVEAVQDDLSYWTDVVGRIRTILGPGANVMIEIVYEWKQHVVGGGEDLHGFPYLPFFSLGQNEPDLATDAVVLTGAISLTPFHAVPKQCARPRPVA